MIGKVVTDSFVALRHRVFIPGSHMLLDPTVLKTPQTPGTLLTLPATVDVNFARVGTGLYSSISSPFSLDNPARIKTKSTVRNGAPSSALVRYEMDRSLLPVNGVTPPDKTAALWIGHNLEYGIFTYNDVMALLVGAVSVYQSNLTRLMNGES